MPVDPTALRHIVDEIERLTDSIRNTAVQLRKTDPTKPDNTYKVALAWARNVQALKAGIEKQQAVSVALRETARIQDEHQGELFRDRYRFLVERLKGEIRGLFHAMRDLVDLPQDFNRQRTWNDSIYDMEVELKSLGAAHAGEHGLSSVDAIVSLLNYRDKVLTLTLAGVLFQKAVLDWDLKTERSFADGPMVEMAEKVVELYSKTDCVPAKYRLAAVPRAQEAGPFSLNYKPNSRQRAPLTDLQKRFTAVLHELQSLDKSLYNIAFAEKVHMDVRGGSGEESSGEEFRVELLRWTQHYEKLTKQLNATRKTKGEGKELAADLLLKKLEEKEQVLKQHYTTIHKLEGDFQSQKFELMNLKRERVELQEKNNRMAKENMPHLEKMKILLAKSQESVVNLTADTEDLSQIFQKQKKEIARINQEHATIQAEQQQLQTQLKADREKKRLKEEEVAKKEKLYLRTMAARQIIEESCTEQRQHIESLDARAKQFEKEMEDMRQVLLDQEAEVTRFKAELGRAAKRKKELQTQIAACMKEYEASTGNPPHRLLGRFQANPTLPLSATSPQKPPA